MIRQKSLLRIFTPIRIAKPFWPPPPGIVFISHKQHSVKPVLGGLRRALPADAEPGEVDLFSPAKPVSVTTELLSLRHSVRAGAFDLKQKTDGPHARELNISRDESAKSASMCGETLKRVRSPNQSAASSEHHTPRASRSTSRRRRRRRL